MSEFVLKSGSRVKQPFNKIWFVVGAILIMLMIAGQFIPTDFRNVQLGELGVIIKKLFVPYGGRTWADYFGYFKEMGTPLLQTIQISLGGTVIGSLFAFPFAFLTARNVIKNKYISIPIKFVMNFIRSIPTIILAVLATFLVGNGVLSGIVAITLFSFGIMAKMLYEAIETVDMGPFEALESTGANKLVAFRHAIVTQITPIYLGYLIYIFEINIRASAILGYVGAGGIGSVISDNILYNYNRVGVAIIVIFITVIIVQVLSSTARRYIK